MRRSVNQLMILALIILSGIDFVDCAATFFDTYATFPKTLDESGAKTCFMLNGQIEQFNPNSVDHGFKCTYTANVWTTDKNAREFCESNTPFPVIPELVQSINGGQTKCGFLITLQCKPDWWQIEGLCYKVVGKFTFSEAKTFCETKLEHQDTEPKLAEFYSTSFGMFLEHMHFSEVWVTVPEITEYFLDGVGEAAVFVNDGAFKYDTKQGTLILQKENTKHPALCQYKPGITTAEVYRRAKEFEEIYPIYTQDNGINVVTSSYLTVNQKSARKFDNSEMRERCKSLGKIIDVESFPVVPMESEWNEARRFLKNHRFYLTSAFKNTGCNLKDYLDYDVISGAEYILWPDGSAESNCNAFSFSFNENKRLTSVAGMRAPAICGLHSYSLQPAECPDGWIPFDRAGNFRFCHYISDRKGNHPTLQEYCLTMGAALTGFDTEEELQKVTRKAGGLRRLGGVTPCAVNCQPDFLASWDEGVARNNTLLNSHGHSDYDPDWWKLKSSNTIITWCYGEIHTHGMDEFSGLARALCGKYSGFTSKKIEKNRLVTKR